MASGGLFQLLCSFILCLITVVATPSENLGNLIDPCFFPTPHYTNFAGLCQYSYHQISFVCDPLALLSRTESEILSQRFDNYSLAGCVNCESTPRQGCVPTNSPNTARVSVLIVPYTNTQRIESCVGGRFRKISASEAARAYAELVQRNWGESGCTADLTILYIGTLHNPLTNLRQPNPFVVRLFSNNLSHLSQMSSVKMVNNDQGLFEILQSEINNSLSIAQINTHFTGTNKLSQKPNQLNGVPLWAFEICGVLLVLVVFMVYLGNCLTKRFNTRAQQKKFNGNRSNGLLSAQNSNNGGGGSRVGFSGGLLSGVGGNSNGGSTQNNSLMSNLAVRDTKSSMMFRQFSAHNAKKQQDRAKANIQKI
ncbi:hypothetical protein M3Y97_00619800 [Aphelenchoides bicaudatus]|nr:hypothetical protein M3Y97_00619800 [Aphelenchoides bicaudatus]